MKISRLVYVLATVLFLSACQNDHLKSTNYEDYHKTNLEAEHLISEEKYSDALQLYKDLIEGYDFIFLRDCKIASQLALYSEENELALSLIEKGIANGWDINELEKDKFLVKHLNESQWKHLKDSYDGLHRKYLERIDATVTTKVKSMIEKDQQLAEAASYIEDEDEQEAFLLDNFVPHSKQQLFDLIDIMESHGYPGELLIGNDFWTSTILSHHNSISEDHTKQDTLYPFIRPKLLESIDSGYISPYEFALMEDWRMAIESDYEVSGYGYLNSPKTSTLDQVNQLRSAIGLRSVELRNKLVNIEQKTGMRFYLPDWVEGKINIDKE